MFPTKTSRKFLAYCVEALLVAIFLAPSASADTIYTYTGNAFDSFPGNFACPPVCKITGSFTLAQPLPPNLSFVTIFPKFFSFTDGAITLTPNNSFPFIFQPFTEFSTDSTGAITTWDIRIQGKQSLGFPRLGSANVPGAAIEDATAVLFTPGAINTNNPGVWSVATTNIPEPNCFLLLLTGLVSITGTKRIGVQGRKS
jgi:hypothetical protein